MIRCPNAVKVRDGHYMCEASGPEPKPCAHQRYCGMKGTWVLSDQAAQCPKRKDGGGENDHV